MKKTILLSIFACVIASNFDCEARPSTRRNPSPEFLLARQAAQAAAALRAAYPDAAQQVNEVDAALAVLDNEQPADVIVDAAPPTKMRKLQQVLEKGLEKAQAFWNLVNEHPFVAFATVVTAGTTVGAITAYYNHAIAQPVVNGSDAQPNVEYPVKKVTVDESSAQPKVEYPVKKVTVHDSGAQPKVENAVPVLDAQQWFELGLNTLHGWMASK